MKLLDGRANYKPFVYPWAFDMYRKQQDMHWVPGDIEMHNDVADLKKLSPEEYTLVTNIQKFFTQSDVDVGEGYVMKYGPALGKHPEVRMMLSAFANMEAIHAEAYSLWLDTVGLPETEYLEFTKYEVLRNKHEYASQFSMDTPRDIAKSLAVYSGFTEGMQLFSAFAMLLHFGWNRGILRGMGQIVTYSIRDESLHVEGMCRLFREFCEEYDVLDDSLKQEIIAIASEMEALECEFIDLAFDICDVVPGAPGKPDLTKEDIKAYVRYIKNYRLAQLGCVANSDEPNPLPWIDDALQSVEFANFFETRVTEYTHGTLGNFGASVWGR